MYTGETEGRDTWEQQREIDNEDKERETYSMQREMDTLKRMRDGDEQMFK